MKENKSNITFNKNKGSILFHGNERAMKDNHIADEWTLHKINGKVRMQSSDFKLITVNKDNNKPVLQPRSKSTKKTGSHSLTELQHFKTFHR